VHPWRTPACVEIEFDEPQRANYTGGSGVLYSGELVLGGDD